MQETSEKPVQSLGWEDPLEEGMQLTPVFLPGKSHEQRNLVGYSPWGRKESDVTERLTQKYDIDLVYCKGCVILSFLPASQLVPCLPWGQ